MDLKSLDNITLKAELDGKDEIVKSVRFSKEEFYMIKFIESNNKKFSAFIKELIQKSINEEVEIKDTTSIIDINKLKEEVKEEIKEEILREISLKDREKTSIAGNEAREDVLNFLNSRK